MNILDNYLKSALQSAANDIAIEELDNISWKITYRLRGCSGYKHIKSKYERKAYQSLLVYLNVVKQELKEKKSNEPL